MYYCTNISVQEGRNEFKIRYGANEWYGTSVTDLIQIGGCLTIYETDGNNLRVTPGTYDFYFDYYNHNLFVMEQGKAPFYIMGTCNAWTGTMMTVENGYLVAKNLDFTSGDDKGGPRFKILYGSTNWTNNPYNIGDYSNENATVGTSVLVTNDSGSGDINLPSGTYDIYLDMNRVNNNEKDMTVWVMAPGQTPADVIAE